MNRLNAETVVGLSADDLLDRLCEAMRRQRELAEEMNLVAFSLGQGDVGRILAELTRLKPAFNEEQIQRFTECHQAHYLLCLSLSQQKAELSRKLTTLQRKKKTINAYRDSL